ncbi:MAG TPA: CoA transferase, partial [Gemmataceae bacterium]|nr:CoA transferase [Gemmataceae bacterium]
MEHDSGPVLHDVRVLDASRVLAGPLCGQILADLGAEVVKIERPGTGDETRAWGPPFVGETSAYYLSCNRNKRSVAIDLAKAEGIQLLHDLARRSDVLLENFLPSSAQKLGLDPQQLFKINPRLVIC